MSPVQMCFSIQEENNTTKQGIPLNNAFLNWNTDKEKWGGIIYVYIQIIKC